MMKNEILWTHHEKGGIVLGRSGKSDAQYKNMERMNTGGLDKNDGRQKTLEEHHA